MAERSKRKPGPREVFQGLERMAEDAELAEKIEGMSDAELDRDLRGQGGDPHAIAERARALVDRLAGADEGPPVRMAAGLPLRQTLLAILADAARDPRKKALMDEELAGKPVEAATDDELARAVARVRG